MLLLRQSNKWHTTGLSSLHRSRAAAQCGGAAHALAIACREGLAGLELPRRQLFEFLRIITTATAATG